MPDLDALRVRRRELMRAARRRVLGFAELRELGRIRLAIRVWARGCDPADGPELRCAACHGAPAQCGPCWFATRPTAPMHPMERIGDDEGCGGK